MKVGIVALAYVVVLVAVSIAVGVLAFGSQVSALVEALHRLAP